MAQTTFRFSPVSFRAPPVQPVIFQIGWIFMILLKSTKLKIKWWIFCTVTLFYYDISNWLSHVNQTNHNNDLISTTKQNDSTRLKTIYDTFRGILFTWFNLLEKINLVELADVQKFHLFTSTRLILQLIRLFQLSWRHESVS